MQGDIWKLADLRKTNPQIDDFISDFGLVIVGEPDLSLTPDYSGTVPEWSTSRKVCTCLRPRPVNEVEFFELYEQLNLPPALGF